ncbi:MULTISPECIES: hypothetical protein [unclassified Streptomyces]|uniref:hypothetical protein n=1 Tax=unclassified Streptomyces TaxID=2593676 RepID=UPI0036B5615D
MPHELIRWTARRGDQIAACLAEPEHEYVTAVDDDGEPLFLPVVSERARAKMNQITARKSRPPKQKTRPLARLRVVEGERDPHLQGRRRRHDLAP